MAFDYKKEYREFYLPKERPEIVTVPPMNYIAVRGKGDPNIADGEYQAAMGMLYGVAFTIKMSKKGSHCIEGYFDYVVPPLEGFWWQEGIDGVDFAHKDEFGDTVAGFRNQGGFPLGCGRSCEEEKAGFFQGGVFYG